MQHEFLNNDFNALRCDKHFADELSQISILTACFVDPTYFGTGISTDSLTGKSEKVKSKNNKKCNYRYQNYVNDRV